jgi:hypothetical protein
MLATDLHAWLKGRRLSVNVYDEVISLKLFTWGILLFEAEHKCSLEDAITSFQLTYDAIQTRRVRPGDILTLGPKAKEMALIAEAQSLAERDVPDYVVAEADKATFVRVPTLDEVPYPVKMEPNLVVEFYSR